jgi:cell division protein FtsN
MPRDYARSVNKPKRPLPEQGWRKRLLWVGCLLLVLGIVIYSVNIYQHPTDKAGDSSQTLGLWIKQVKSLFIRAPKKQDTSELALKEVVPEEAKQDTEIQFSFYTNLSNMQVPVPQQAESKPLYAQVSTPQSQVVAQAKSIDIPTIKPVIPPIAAQTVTTPVKSIVNKYLLQIAAFRNPTAAGEMRISLLLAGFEVEIVKAINSNQQIYQLQQGPYPTIAQAKVMQRVLKNKGIDSVIVKKIE